MSKNPYFRPFPCTILKTGIQKPFWGSYLRIVVIDYNYHTTTNILIRMHLSGRGWACSNGKGTLSSTDVCKLCTKIWTWEILTNFWYCLLNDGEGKAMSQCYILVNPVIVSSLQVWYAYCVVCPILLKKRVCTLVPRWHSVNSILIKPIVPARGVN